MDTQQTMLMTVRYEKQKAERSLTGPSPGCIKAAGLAVLRRTAAYLSATPGGLQLTAGWHERLSAQPQRAFAATSSNPVALTQNPS